MNKGNKIIRTQNIIRNEKEINLLVIEDRWISENDILCDKYNNIYNILYYDILEDLVWDDELKIYHRMKRACIQVDKQIKTDILYIIRLLEIK